MKYKFFNVPIAESVELEKELNNFITSHRIISVTKDLIKQDERVFWAFAVEYYEDQSNHGTGKKPKVDYREILSIRRRSRTSNVPGTEVPSF